MAFTCTLSAGFQLTPCTLGQGGVRTLYIAPWSALTYTLSADDTITAINNSGATFYKFDCVVETAEFNEKGTTNIQNQSLFHEQTVTVLIPKQSAAKRNQYKVLTSSGALIIVEDNQGVLHLIGKTAAAFNSDSSAGTGKESGSFNGYTISMTAKEPEPSFIVASTGAFTYSY